MLKLKLVIMLLFTLSGVVNAASQELALSAEDAAIKAKLTKELKLLVLAINETSAKGIKEVQTNGGIFYVTADGNHLLRGELFELAGEVTNLTANTMAKLRVKGIQKFTKDAIQFKAKDEKYVITAFINFPCPYCAKMHKQIKEYNELGITVNYLAIGGGGIDVQKLAAVWCSKDQKSALTNLLDRQDIPNTACDHSLREQMALAGQVGIPYAATLVLKDGQLMGYQSPKNLLQVLEQINSQ